MMADMFAIFSSLAKPREGSVPDQLARALGGISPAAAGAWCRASYHGGSRDRHATDQCDADHRTFRFARPVIGAKSRSLLLKPIIWSGVHLAKAPNSEVARNCQHGWG
jgi:hypothetical protein